MMTQVLEHSITKKHKVKETKSSMIYWYARCSTVPPRS